MVLSAIAVNTEAAEMTTYSSDPLLGAPFIQYKRTATNHNVRKKPDESGPGAKSYPLWKSVVFTTNLV